MTTATVTPSKSGKPAKFRRDHKINWWLTAAVAVLSLTILIPLYFTIVTALKTPAEAGTFALPTSWQWHNFADASAKVNYPKAALNSAIITVAAVVLTLLTNTFVAYAVARNMDKRFFRFLYYFFIAAMFVPFPVVMLPIAKQMGSLHLDNQVGLIILYTVLGLGTNLFIATGFIRSIPVSLEEAARIDGASTWRIFWTIIFPLMSPINATARPVRLQLAVRHQLSDGLLQLPDGHGPDPRRLHLRPEVGHRWSHARRCEVVQLHPSLLRFSAEGGFSHIAYSRTGPLVAPGSTATGTVV